MGLQVAAALIIGAIAYAFHAFDSEQALFLTALPMVAALTFIILGPS
ncbi:MAG: hypothetical protein ABL907_11315 [Hyphomicrobium sp.]